MTALTAWEAAARHFEPPVRRWPSPLAMARTLGMSKSDSTPALDRIDRELVRVTDDPSRRLGIFMPPQEGKSESASRRFPVWLLSTDPALRIAVLSYDDTRAQRWGRSIRRDLRAYPTIGATISPDSASVGRFETTSGGMVLAAGMNSGITGEPVDVVVIDDPVKGRREAESATTRESTWDVWENTILPRLGPGAIVVLMQCIVASMRVLTGDGRWTAIEDVRPGDAVVSLSLDGRELVTAKVLGQKLSGYDDTVTVRTDRLALKVNRAHPFGVVRRGPGRPRADDLEWVQAGDLAVGDIVVTAKALPADYSPADVLPDGSAVDETRAWLLGYLTGDGWVTAHRRRNQQGNPTTYAVCCAQGKSTRPEKADLNERVLAALTEWSPNRVYATSGGYWRTDWAAGGRLLHGMGYGAGAHGKRIPDAVWSWSPALRRAFLFGYVEADGALQYTPETRKSGPTWRVGSVNRALLVDARDLALTCGVRPTTVFTNKPRAYQPPNSPAPVMSTLHTLGLTFIPNTPEGASMLREYHHPAPQHLRYEKVRAVEAGPVLPVYDLMVEGTETFVAEGFVTHNTRWHTDDLAGRLLEREAGLWRVLSIPALAEEGDPLGREPGAELPSVRRRPPGYFRALSDRMSPYVFRSVYQQRPTSARGSMFLRDAWRYWHRLPNGQIDLDGSTRDLRDQWRLITVDLAGSTKTSADWTVAAAWALTQDGQLVLLDRVRERTAEADHWGLVQPLAERWNTRDVGVESTMMGTTLVRSAAAAGLRPFDLHADRDKITRALPYSHLQKQRHVWLPDDAPWLDEWIGEHADFPNAPHDDQVDVGAYAARLSVVEWNPGGDPVPDHRPTEPDPLDRWDGGGGTDLSSAEW